MALYAFDGTGNEDNPNDNEDSNVLKFSNSCGGSGNFYVEGVGTRYGLLGSVLGGVFGMGGHSRVEEAMERLNENFANGDQVIDIIGFSRGAALALEFANEIVDAFEELKQPIPDIRFLGLWDTVGSFGIPGNNTNLGYELTVPTNVLACRHAISLDERRLSFPLTRITQDKFSGKTLRDIEEVWFRGYHSDVGGANKNDGLSNISLHWMYMQARQFGLTLDPSAVSRAAAGRAPDDAPKTPGMDRRPNKKRTIRETDKVHESVKRIEKAGRFAANNPPKGLAVVNDAGTVLANGFEE